MISVMYHGLRQASYTAPLKSKLILVYQNMNNDLSLTGVEPDTLVRSLCLCGSHTCLFVSPLFIVRKRQPTHIARDKDKLSYASVSIFSTCYCFPWKRVMFAMILCTFDAQDTHYSSLHKHCMTRDWINCDELLL